MDDNWSKWGRRKVVNERGSHMERPWKEKYTLKEDENWEPTNGATINRHKMPKR